jgi:hypothetical protein
MEKKPAPQTCEHERPAATCPYGPCNGFLTKEECARLTDEAAIKMAGGNGPAMIGTYLFERAQVANTVNPEGKFGPMLLADESELRASGKIPLDRHGRRLNSSKQSEAPPSSSETESESSENESTGDSPALTEEEKAAELERRIAEKKARGVKMAPSISEDEQPKPPPVAAIAAAANEEFDKLAEILDNPDSTDAERANAEQRMAELTEPKFSE